MGMLDDWEKQRERELQYKVDFVKLQMAKEEPTISEGIKALLAVNGGGIVAMLGFMQALISKPNGELVLFKYYGANSMLLFCGGLVCATLVPAVRLVFIKRVISHQSTEISYPQMWEVAAFLLWGASVTLFLFGIVWAALGIRNTFGL